MSPRAEAGEDLSKSLRCNVRNTHLSLSLSLSLSLALTSSSLPLTLNCPSIPLAASQPHPFQHLNHLPHARYHCGAPGPSQAYHTAVIFFFHPTPFLLHPGIFLQMQHGSNRKPLSDVFTVCFYSLCFSFNVAILKRNIY